MAPQPDRLTTDVNPALCQQLFNIAVTKIEAELEPHRVPDDVHGRTKFAGAWMRRSDDIGWESMAFICGGASIHSRILAQGQLTWQYPFAHCRCVSTTSSTRLEHIRGRIALHGQLLNT